MAAPGVAALPGAGRRGCHARRLVLGVLGYGEQNPHLSVADRFYTGVRRTRHLVAACGEDAVNAEVAPLSGWPQLVGDQDSLTATGSVSYEFFNIYQARPAALFDTHADLLTSQGGSLPHLVILEAGRFTTTLVLEAAR
ncbi:MAG: hypothetical protein WBF75_13520 [Pseudonocardiaceae bacterium]